MPDNALPHLEETIRMYDATIARLEEDEHPIQPLVDDLKQIRAETKEHVDRLRADLAARGSRHETDT